MLKTLFATFTTVVNNMGSSISHQSALDTITTWRAKPAHELIFDSGRDSTAQYFQAVDKLQQSSSPADKRSTELVSISMARLKKEFQAVLSRQAEFPAGLMEWSSVTDTTAYTLRYEDFTGYQIPNHEVVVYLREIVKRMKVYGSLNECVVIYKSVRSNFLKGQVKKLHYDELRIGGDSLRGVDWDVLRVRIELWNQVSKICVRIFFEKEKELCGEVFGGLGGVIDECFVGTVQELVSGLFAFAQAVSLSNQSCYRLGTVFGFYSAFWWLSPHVKSLFGCERGVGIRRSCEEVEGRIESEVERMLFDLERDVLNEIPNSSDDRGGICKTTRVVMDLVDHIVVNRDMLSAFIKSNPSLNADGSIFRQEDLGDTRERSFLELHLILIAMVLQRNIVRKSKGCKEPLRNLFIVNNFHYIVNKIKGSSELQRLIGNFYVESLRGEVESSMKTYEEWTCNKFLTCLRDEGMYFMNCFRPGLSRSVSRRRLKAFNMAFDEIKSTQSSWTVPDLQLREQIRTSMSGKLVPEYETFLGKLRDTDIGKKKYSVQDLESLISEEILAYTL